MRPLSRKITSEKWMAMPKKQQLLNLSAELARVSSAFGKYGNEDQITKEGYERAIEMVDLMLEDKRWREMAMNLRFFRDSLASLYLNKVNPEVVNFFSRFFIDISQFVV